MPVADELSISRWLNALHDGQADAFQALWERYFEGLVAVADKHMRTAPTVLTDGEDVAASVFESIWSGVRAGRFKKVKDLDDIWWLLVTMTHRKCIDHIRRDEAEKRGGGRPPLSIERDPEKLYNLLVSQQPDPQYVVSMNEQYQRALAILDDSKQRRIAVLRVEGHTIAEIATDLRVAEATVIRKLKIVRQFWGNELRDDSRS